MTTDDVGRRLERAMRALAQVLQPTVPLITFDVEGTGPYPERDRIVEFGLAKYYPPSPEHADGAVTTWATLVNPQRPIPADATAVHGITDEMVADAPIFEALAPKIAERFQGCTFIGYNLRRYDIKILRAEFKRAGVSYDPAVERVLDPFQIFRQREPRDLGAAMRFYTGQDIDGAHRVLGDVAATAEVLAAQLERYDDLPRSLDELDTYCLARPADWIDPDGKFRWSGDVAVVNIGDHAGTPLRDVDAGFLRWILKKDFSDEAKQIARDALNGKYPARTAEVTP